MTLKELLFTQTGAYFYYDPKRLDKERKQIPATTPACSQEEAMPVGWLTGGRVRMRQDEILVDLAEKDGGPYLDRIKVV